MLVLSGLSPDSVLEAFRETDQLPEVLPTPGRETDHSVTVNPVLWGFWAVVILLAFGLGVYLLLGDDGRPPEPAPVASPVEREPDLSSGEPISGIVSQDTSAPIEEEISRAGCHDACQQQYVRAGVRIRRFSS